MQQVQHNTLDVRRHTISRTVIRQLPPASIIKMQQPAGMLEGRVTAAGAAAISNNPTNGDSIVDSIAGGACSDDAAVPSASAVGSLGMGVLIGFIIEAAGFISAMFLNSTGTGGGHAARGGHSPTQHASGKLSWGWQYKHKYCGQRTLWQRWRLARPPNAQHVVRAEWAKPAN